MCSFECFQLCDVTTVKSGNVRYTRLKAYIKENVTFTTPTVYDCMISVYDIMQTNNLVE